MARDRAAALEQVAKVEKERAAIMAEQEKLLNSLEQESAREEIESAIRRLEQEKEEKSKLAQERAAALEQLAHTERTHAREKLDNERARVMEMAQYEVQKKEIEDDRERVEKELIAAREKLAQEE